MSAPLPPPVVPPASPRRPLTALWQWFRGWPLWVQAIGWLLAWPALVALFVAGASRQSTARYIAAVAVLLIAAPPWAEALLGAEPAAGPEPVDAEEPPARELARNAPPAEAPATAAPATEQKQDPGPAKKRAAKRKPKPVAQSAAPAPAPQSPAPAPKPKRPKNTWRVVHVVDGDTVDVVSSRGASERVRVIGIDTPERGECGFGPASSALAKLVLDRQVKLRPGARDDRDRYGRLLRYVDVDGTDAGLRLIKKGLATARYDSRDGYGRHPREDRYVAADSATEHRCNLPAPAAPAPPADAGLPPGGAYANCTAAREAGAAPVRRGDPGYGPHLDGDGDGIGCE